MLLLATLSAAWLFLPPRPGNIVEGPMLQQVTETGAIIAWYGNGESAFDVSVDGAGTELDVTVHPDNGRYELRLRDLQPASDYRYAIRYQGRHVQEQTFRTAGGATAAVRMLVFGDTGTGTRAQYRMGETMAQQDADIALHTGDVIYEHGERDHYAKRFFEPYADMLSRIAIWPVLGNHDMHEPAAGKPFLEVFSLPENGPADLRPETNYWFDYGPARIAAIDTTGDRAAKLQSIVPWLNDVFSDRAREWRIVLSHYCPYSVIKPRPALQELLVPALESLSVDLVLCGHDHFYMRSHPMRLDKSVAVEDGVTYLISGAAADLTRVSDKQRNMPFVALLDTTQPSYTLLNLTAQQIGIRQIGQDGTLLDEYAVIRRGN